jgi:hypothetical protein
MMLKILLSAAVSSAVAGPNPAMLTREPVITLKSAQAVNELQHCVGLALADIGKPVVTYAPGRRHITFGAPEHSPVLITLVEGDPVIIEVRKSFALNKKWRNRVRFCAS